jgi:hypothetical protein
MLQRPRTAKPKNKDVAELKNMVKELSDQLAGKRNTISKLNERLQEVSAEHKVYIYPGILYEDFSERERRIHGQSDSNQFNENTNGAGSEKRKRGKFCRRRIFQE